MREQLETNHHVGYVMDRARAEQFKNEVDHWVIKNRPRLEMRKSWNLATLVVKLSSPGNGGRCYVRLSYFAVGIYETLIFVFLFFYKKKLSYHDELIQRFAGFSIYT